MSEQTKAELAWDAYNNACKELTDLAGLKAAFVNAVESQFGKDSVKFDAKDYTGSFESASDKDVKVLRGVYNILPREVALSSISILAELVYVAAKGQIKIKDLPENGVKMQLVVLQAIARQRLSKAQNYSILADLFKL